MDIDIEIILIEQDSARKIDIDTLPSNCEYVFAYNEGLFNRAWGLNVGFRHSSGKAIAFADNDVVVDREILQDSFTLCSDEYDYDAIKPFNKLIDMTEKESGRILGSGRPLDSLQFKGKNIRAGISFCSALTVFRRNAYEQIGGYDERFVGWGGEDDAMSRFKIPLLKKAYVVEGNAYHLWHERSVNDSGFQPNYKNNLRLLWQYYSYSTEDILQLCEKSRLGFGRLKNGDGKQVHRSNKGSNL